MANWKDDVTGDYSCGNCGWWGTCDNCELVIMDEESGDCEVRCPECGSEQVGEVTAEDFKEGNKLFGKLWRGEKIF